MRHVFRWNPMSELRDFEIGLASRLTVATVNLVLESCPKLQRLARLSGWGGVTAEQAASLRREARLRNLDLVFDDDDEKSRLAVA